MNINQAQVQAVTRRHFLASMSRGIGGMALASLIGNDLLAANPASTVGGLPHYAAKARRIIYIHLAGSPPQQDLFDYKPKLAELDGKPAPDSLYKDKQFAFIKGTPKILASPYEFEQTGGNGQWISELIPHFRDIVDDVTLIHSLHTDEFNHAPAQLFLQTGSPRFGRPSMGSWLTYGLGSDNEDLPAFIVLASGGKKPSAGNAAWGSGFLPTIYQGVQCRSTGDPILYVKDPKGMDREGRRQTIDAINKLNQMQHDTFGDPETLTRIEQYELAFRMQVSVPEVMDIGRESKETLEMYGAEPGKASLANNCLLARRLSEAGVRFVQLYDWGWDVHGTGKHDDIMHQLPMKCKQMDQPVAALIKDLKQRGMLDETLVVWSGEFGRTAMNEARNGSKFLGRDHHPGCFTMWMAGGGTKRGAVIGKTDDFSYTVAEQPIHIHDLQATILRLLGIDHERLTYRFQGRDFRLTDVHGHVVEDVMA